MLTLASSESKNAQIITESLVVESGGVLRPLEELVLVDYDLAWTVEHHDSILMSWAFYLGGGEEP